MTAGFRGYSWGPGPDTPFHAEERPDGWAIFHCFTDLTWYHGLREWKAIQLADRLNYPKGSDPYILDSVP